MHSYPVHKNGFIESFCGLLLNPAETTEELLAEEHPPFTIPIIFILIASILIPLGIQHLSTIDTSFYTPVALYSVFVVLALTLTLFIAMEYVMFQIVIAPMSFRSLYSITIYCLVPVTATLILVYCANYYYSGSLTFLTLIMTGYAKTTDNFLSVLPIVFVVLQFYVLIIFFSGIRAASECSGFTSFALTIFSIIPFYVAFIAAIVVGDSIYPGTIEIAKFLLVSVQGLAASLFSQ